MPGYTYIYLNIIDVSNDSFLCRELKKSNGILIFFKLSNDLFSIGAASTNKLCDGILVMHF